MSASNERTVVLGLMSYIDEKGAHRVANAGAKVRVHPDQLERFDRLNVLALPPESAQTAAPVEIESSPDELADDANDDETPADSWTVPQLLAFAKDKDIDLGAATKKADILAAILAARSAADPVVSEENG
jgi:hypothetical protein